MPACQGSEPCEHTRPMGNGLSLGQGQSSRGGIRSASQTRHGSSVTTSGAPGCHGLFTSADALLLSRQDPRSVDDAYAVQDRVGQLGAHEPAGGQEPGRGRSRLGHPALRAQRCFLSAVAASASSPRASGLKVFFHLTFQGRPANCTHSLFRCPAGGLKLIRISISSHELSPRVQEFGFLMCQWKLHKPRSPLNPRREAERRRQNCGTPCYNFQPLAMFAYTEGMVLPYCCRVQPHPLPLAPWERGWQWVASGSWRATWAGEWAGCRHHSEKPKSAEEE